jgi:GNAT superfamily N-acetyltransferase
MADLSSPVPIEKRHDCAAFDCGHEALNAYLRRYALQNHCAGAARTYVTARGRHVMGFYTLSYGSVTHEQAPHRIRAGLARHPIPVLVLARLGVDLREQGKGLGKGLLKDALLRALQAADIAGLRAVVVHAKDQAAREFYVKYGFEPSPIDDLHLMLLMKDLRQTVADR